MAIPKKTEIRRESSVPADPEPNLEEAIRKRAYELYMERGGTDGSTEEDWFRAEADILTQRGKRSNGTPKDAA